MGADRRRAELFYDRGHHQEFLSLSQELAAPGELRQAQTFDFLFKNVEKQYESYQGINVKLRCVMHLSPAQSLLLTDGAFGAQVLCASHNIAEDGRRHERQGHMGPFLPHASR